MLDAILRPQSIAVIGASRRPGTIGHETVASLIRCGFAGAVYRVNPDAHSICSVPAFPSVQDLPGPVDLAVVTVPKQQVQPVVEEGGRPSPRGCRREDARRDCCAAGR